MDTLKDIWASLVAGVQERTTNPLTFSFIASWCLCNFKFFFILAGDGTTAERLLAVDELFPFTWSTYFGHAFGIPLVLACLYVFAYPSLSSRVIEHYRKKQVAIANIVREIEGARLLTVDEASQRTRLHETERTAWQERESALLTQLQATREALSAAEKQANDAGKVVLNQPTSTSSATSSKPLESGRLERFDALLTSNPAESLSASIMKNLSTFIDPISLDILANNLKENPLLVKSELQRMSELRLVNEDTARRWSLTSNGEELALSLLRKPKVDSLQPKLESTNQEW